MQRQAAPRRLLIASIGGFSSSKVDSSPRNDGRDGVLVHHLSHGIAQQHDILIERFDLALQLDAVHKINGHRYMLAAQRVQKRVLEKLAFVAHDMFRVQTVVVGRHLTTAAL